MACDPSTLLSSGKAFQGLSERDQLIVMAQLLCDISGVLSGSGLTISAADQVNPLTITRASDGKNVFSLIANPVANQWNLLIGSHLSDQVISDTHFYQSASGFFRVDFGSSGYAQFENGGNLVVNEGGGADDIPVFSSDGAMAPSKLNAYTASGPTPTIGAAAGTGGTVAVSFSDLNPTDVSFRVHLRTGNASMATGTLLTVTFTSTYGVAPKVIFSAASATACAEIAKVYVDQAAVTSALFLFKAGAALTANTDYYWDFIVCG